MFERHTIICRPRRWALPLAALLMLVPLSTPAAAQTGGGPDAAQRADALFAEGKALRKAGRKAEARERYMAALALKKSYDVAGNLGSLELDLGLFRDAAEHLSFALRTYASSGSTPEQLAKARAMLAEARQHVSAVKVAVNVQGAEVLVDGKSAGHAPLADDVFVEPGTRVVEARLAGHKEARQTIDAVKGGTQNVALALVPSAGAEPAEESSGTARSGNPPAGGTVKNEETQSAFARPLVIGGLVATGVAGVAGVAFTIASGGEAANVEDRRDMLIRKYGPAACTGIGVPTGCMDLQDSIKSKDALATAALWSFVGAGALGAATLIVALTGPKTARTVRAEASPVVVPQGGGVLIRGAW